MSRPTDNDVTLPPTPVERIGSRAAPPPPAPWWAGRSMRALLVFVVLGTAVAVEALTSPAASEVAAPLQQAPAESGVWYCPAFAETGTATLSIATTGSSPSSIVIVRHTAEGAIAGTPEDVPPGEQRDIVLDEMQSHEPVSVRWSGGPSVVTWRANVGDDAATAIPCSSGPSPNWYVAGLDTARGASSALYLFNPFNVDAVANLTFTTPEGPQTLISTSSELVEANTTRRIDLTGLQPEVADLGVAVEVENGRLVAAGEITYTQRQGEAESPVGRTLVPAAEAPADSWAFGYAVQDDRSDSWLSIMNPGEREAAVELSASSSLTGPMELSVPAGGTLRVPLEEVSSEQRFGVRVAGVNEVPVVVTRTSSIVTDTERGVAASLGAPASAQWAVAGGGSDGRIAELSIYNPGVAPVTATIDAGAGTPPEWRAVEVPANGWSTFDLGAVDPERGNIPAVVTADGPIVAELSSRGEGDALRLWTEVGIPAVRWTGPLTRPAVRRDPLLRTTPLGLPSDDPAEGEIGF